MTRPYFWTIQKKFFLAFLLVGLVPAVVAVLLGAWGAQRSFAVATAGALQPRAFEIADQIGRTFEDRLDLFGELANSYRDNLAAYERDPQIAENVAFILRLTPGDDPEIRLVENKTAPFAAWAATHPESLEDFLRPENLPADGALQEISLLDPQSGEEKTFIFFVFPLSADAGGYVLLFSDAETSLWQAVPPNLPENTRLRLYSQRADAVYPPNVESMVHDELRRQLAGPHVPPPGWFNAREWGDGRLRWQLIAHAAIPRLSRMTPADAAAGPSPWLVVLMYDMENFLGPLSRLLWTLVLVAAAWVLFLLSFSALIARRVVGPVKRLRFQAEAMAAGDLDQRADVRTRDEIQDLATSFNTMADRLRETYRRLEDRAEESRQRAEHIHVINEITKAITQALDLDRTFEKLVRELPKVFNYDGMWIALAGDDGRLRITHSHPPGLLPAPDKGIVPLDRQFEDRSLGDSGAVRGRIESASDDDPSRSAVFSQLGFRSYVLAPLPSSKGPLGTLTLVSRRPDAFNEEDVEVLVSLAGAVGVGIEQAELFHRTRQMAEELEMKVEARTRELARANTQLIQAEKFSATGRLAANLAHEINNPLGIIKNYLRILTVGLQRAGGGRRKSDPNVDHLRVIDEEINRIARIVRQLLDLHRPADQNPRPTDIRAMLEEIVTLVKNDFEKKRIAIEFQAEDDLPQPLVAPDLVRQVYLNLIRNAEDAMEEGGRLTLHARRAMLGRMPDARDAVAVSIADTGVGIPADQLNEIFDPFYTTKSAEKGTGLGLYVSYGIVQRYQGTLEVDSAPARGSTFTVTLPVQPPAEAEQVQVLRWPAEKSRPASSAPR